MLALPTHSAEAEGFSQQDMPGFRRSSSRWWWWAIILIVEGGGVLSCGPSSKQLHICLGVYLERDLPLLETLVAQRRGRVILEGPDLDDICRHVSSLIGCYSRLVAECDSAWKLDRFARLAGVLGATHAHLCANGTGNMRDLLLNSGCLTRIGAQCPGFDWWLSWREVLRMQASPADRCGALQRYRDCLQRHLLCGQDSYVALVDVWLSSWCGSGSSASDYLHYASNVRWSVPAQD